MKMRKIAVSLLAFLLMTTGGYSANEKETDELKAIDDAFTKDVEKIKSQVADSAKAYQEEFSAFQNGQETLTDAEKAKKINVLEEKKQAILRTQQYAQEKLSRQQEENLVKKLDIMKKYNDPDAEKVNAALEAARNYKAITVTAREKLAPTAEQQKALKAAADEAEAANRTFSQSNTPQTERTRREAIEKLQKTQQEINADISARPEVKEAQKAQALYEIETRAAQLYVSTDPAQKEAAQDMEAAATTLKSAANPVQQQAAMLQAQAAQLRASNAPEAAVRDMRAAATALGSAETPARQQAAMLQVRAAQMRASNASEAAVQAMKAAAKEEDPAKQQAAMLQAYAIQAETSPDPQTKQQARTLNAVADSIKAGKKPLSDTDLQNAVAAEYKKEMSAAIPTAPAKAAESVTAPTNTDPAAQTNAKTPPVAAETAAPIPGSSPSQATKTIAPTDTTTQTKDKALQPTATNTTTLQAAASPETKADVKTASPTTQTPAPDTSAAKKDLSGAPKSTDKAEPREANAKGNAAPKQKKASAPHDKKPVGKTPPTAKPAKIGNTMSNAPAKQEQKPAPKPSPKPMTKPVAQAAPLKKVASPARVEKPKASIPSVKTPTEKKK